MDLTKLLTTTTRVMAGLVTIALALSATACSDPAPPGRADDGWVSLFNGEDLSGWETFLSEDPETGQVLGVDHDPRGVFSVQDGEIRISGEVWGALTTREAFEDYHLRLQYRWGDQTWPPRENLARDSGLLYHAVGPHGAQSGHWMRSHELQIMEGNTGDYHSLDGAAIDVRAEEAEVPDGGVQLVYDPGAALREGVRRRVVKQGTYEKPHGEWNTVELIVRADTVVHLVNGHEVLRAHGSRHTVEGREEPLTRGRLQLQSEAAEVFYRNIELRRLD